VRAVSDLGPRASGLGPRASGAASVRPIALAIGVLALAACEGRKAEPTGLGPYQFGKTTRKAITQGVCQPTELTDGRKAIWCFALPPIKVGTRAAEVDAYFLGSDDTAPLIEFQLKIRGCVEDDLDRWMRARFGPPGESKSTRQYWWNSFLWAVAFMPSEPGRCHVHFLPRSEADEIERLKQK
jgi:hypothetical protein